MGAQFETGFFSSPSDLKTAADALDAEVRNIDGAIDGNEEIPQAQWDGFQVFESQWRKFYSDNFRSSVSVTTSWLTTDLQAQLVSFQAQAETWGHQMESFGAKIPGGIIAPADNSLDLKPFGISLDVALVVILVIVVAWKVL